MRKWIEYQLCLVRISLSNSRKLLEFLGGDYGQIVYTLVVSIVVGLIGYLSGGEDNTMKHILFALGYGLVGAIIANALIFLWHFFIKSKKYLFNGIGVRQYKELNIDGPKIVFDEDANFPFVFRVVMKNIGPYPLKDCAVYGRSVTPVLGSKETLPESRLLVWADGKTGERDIDSMRYASVNVFGGLRDSGKAWFITQSPSWNKVPYGIYIVRIELIAHYLWKKIKYQKDIRIEFSKENEGISGKFVDSTN